MAAPPDVLRVDEKNLREHSVFNVCGVVMTTNHKTDGIYLPADDRRHFVAWSEKTKDDFTDGLLERSLEVVRARGLRPRRRLPGRARPFGLQPEGAAAKDGRLLGDRRRQSRAGGRRTRRRPRRARAPRRRDPGHARQRRTGGLNLRVAARPQEPARHPSPARTVRLCPGAQRRGRGWAVHDEQSPPGRLREGGPLHSRPPGSRAQADQSLNPLMRSAQSPETEFYRGLVSLVSEVSGFLFPNSRARTHINARVHLIELLRKHINLEWKKII